MAQFVYLAKNEEGKLVRGSLEATNEKDAREQLRSQSLQLQKIVKASAKKKAKGAEHSFFGSSRVKDKDLQVFFRQFATMVESGITVVDALEILANGMPRGTLRRTVGRLKHSVETGKTLGEAMTMYPHIFDRLAVNMVVAGEDAGALDVILNRICEYIEKAAKIKGKVKSALAYPVVIIIVAGLVVTALLVLVVPKFTKMFTSSGKELPFLTQLVVDMSHGLASQWHYVLGGLFALGFLGRWYFSTKEGAFKRDYFFLNMPIFGSLVTKACVARMSRTLATLLSSGVSILEALDMAAKTSGNTVMENALVKAKQSIATGKTIATPLSKVKEIPDMVVQMIAVGERSGTMDEMLEKVADFYESEVDTAVETLGSLIEPMIMVLLGGVIGFIVIAMYLPIFNMGETLGV